MTRAEAEAHQRKHGFLPTLSQFAQATGSIVKTRRSMTRPEREYELMLEAQKRAGEILEYLFEGMRLKWGVDPDTGEAMWYKPDFVVSWKPKAPFSPLCMKLIEVKGPWINPRDMVRFKGCRAAWPQFTFEMWQRDKDGRWTRIQ